MIKKVDVKPTDIVYTPEETQELKDKIKVEGKAKNKRILTIKERKFVKGIVEGKDKKDSYKEAYDTNANDNTISVEANRTLNRPQVKDAIEQAMAAQGITIDKIVAPVGRALDSTDLEMQLKGHDRAVKMLGVGRDSSGNTFNFVQLVSGEKDEYKL